MHQAGPGISADPPPGSSLASHHDRSWLRYRALQGLLDGEVAAAAGRTHGGQDSPLLWLQEENYELVGKGDRETDTPPPEVLRYFS